MNNLKEGKGFYLYTRGEEYSGDWKNDLRHGKGVYKFSNGDVYEGDYFEDERTGEGIMRYKNGDIYTGHFLKGMKKIIGGFFRNQKANKAYEAKLAEK